MTFSPRYNSKPVFLQQHNDSAVIWCLKHVFAGTESVTSHSARNSMILVEGRFGRLGMRIPCPVPVRLWMCPLCAWRIHPQRRGDPLAAAIHVDRGKGPWGQAVWRGSATVQRLALVLRWEADFPSADILSVSVVAVPLLRCTWTFAAFARCMLEFGAMLVMARRHLHARMAAHELLGPSSAWFLAGGKYVSRRRNDPSKK